VSRRNTKTVRADKIGGMRGNEESVGDFDAETRKLRYSEERGRRGKWFWRGEQVGGRVRTGCT